jgi:hypothetical protein
MIELGKIWGTISDIEALELSAIVSWRSIAERRLHNLIRGIPVRLQAVIDTGGAEKPY